MFSAIKTGISMLLSSEKPNDSHGNGRDWARRNNDGIDDSNLTPEEREIMRRYEEYEDYGHDVYDPNMVVIADNDAKTSETGPPRSALSLLRRPKGTKILRPEGASSDDESDDDIFSDAPSDSTPTGPESDVSSASGVNGQSKVPGDGSTLRAQSQLSSATSKRCSKQDIAPRLPPGANLDSKMASAFSNVFLSEEAPTERSGRAFRRGPRECVERHQDLRTRLRDRKHMLPGEKLWAPNKHIRQARMKGYNIPDALLMAIELGDDLAVVFPELFKPLDLKTYVNKFHALLWCEEAAEVLAMREFDLDCVGLYVLGEYMSLRVPGLADGRPSLIAGDRVILTKPGSNDNIQYEGYIHYVRKDDVLLKFHRTFHEQYNGEAYNCHFMSGRSQAKRQHHIIDNFAPYIGEKVLFPSDGKVFFFDPLKEINHEKDISWQNKELNQRQKFAIINIIKGRVRPTPYLIFGPPGTGKTVTIVEAILQIYLNFPESRILACGISNAATNLIAIKLLESQIIPTKDIVRLLAANRFDDFPEELKEIARKEETSMDSIDEFLFKRIIVTTCGQSGIIWRHQIYPNHFTHVFIDEAAQATEPETLVPLTLGALGNGVVVLSGDPLQLGPVIHSKTAKKHGLARSMMCRLMEELEVYRRYEDGKFTKLSGYNPDFITKLVYNYRSDPSIMSISNQLFYGNELKCAYEVDHDMLKQIGFESSVIFHAVKGEDLRDADCPSWFNPAEVVEVSKYLAKLYQAKLKPEDIGIITPYRKQTEKVRMFIRSLDMEMPTVATIEEFQGGERNVIILTTVRSSPQLIQFDQRYNLGFVFNERRINVALSRAKALIIVIGNPDVLRLDKTWSKFLNYCIENKFVHGDMIVNKASPQDSIDKDATSANIDNGIDVEQNSAPRVSNGSPDVNNSLTSNPVTTCDDEVVTTFHAFSPDDDFA